MNPHLFLLLGLALSAPLLLRRREAAWGWLAAGLAGLALLAPALALPDGVPSPAASLGAMTPWQGRLDPADGNENLRDVTHQVQPWLLFLRGEWREGRPPFWNPHQLAGTPFWSNGQGAPLFPLHLLFAALPVPLGLLLLPWLRVAIGGSGAFVLARAMGAGRGAAALAAVAFPLSGMVSGFLLYPMGNALMLVPWAFVAVERIAAGRGGWRPLAVVGSLGLLSGHPETAVFTALLAAIFLLLRGVDEGRRWPAWGRFLGGWTGGALLAAPQILPLFLTLLESGKWLVRQTAPPPAPGVVLALWSRFVLPDGLGDAAAGSWWGPYNDVATAVYVGGIPFALALAALPAAVRDRRLRALALVGLLALAGAYHLPGARQLLLAAPVLGRAIHHYLKFGVELVLVLLAARGATEWVERPGRRLAVASGALVLGLGAAWWAFATEWAGRGLVREQLAWSAALLLSLSLLLAARALRPEQRRRLLPALAVLAALDLAFAHARSAPGLPAGDLYPRTGATAFLEGREGRVAGVDAALHPNAAMVYGLRDLRGDDPVKLWRYDLVYGELAGAPDPVYHRPVQDWSSRWLDILAVRWVVAAPDEGPRMPDWRLAYEGGDARVWERPAPLPLTRWEDGSLAVVEVSQPGRWTFDTGAPERPRRLVVAETWDRGWRARIDGRPAHLEREHDLLLAVEVPAGARRVELVYRPRGLAGGLALGLAGLLALAAPSLPGIAARIRRVRASAMGAAPAGSAAAPTAIRPEE